MGATLRSALLVFLAGASYGAMAPVVKTAYGVGFTWQQTTAGQACFGVLLFLAACAVQRLRGQRWRPMDGRAAAKLLGTGAMTCSTCILYSIALSYLPVAVALTLLFQFTWVGVAIQMIATRRPPKLAEVASALIVMGGTLLASGMMSVDLAISYHPLGIACGLASAVTCASFMFLTSRVETELPAMQRGLVICCGAAALALVACPTYLIAGTVVAEAPYGLAQGFFALLLPVVLFGLGGPHLPTGIVSILAASELPAALLLTFLVLGERMDGWQMLGVAIILAGVVVCQLPALREGGLPSSDS